MALKRATQVTSTVFGNVTKKNIRVGWIDPVRGFVDGYDICAANDQARRDPGTVFIYVDGNHTINYININDVNKLEAEDTLSTTQDECGGINQKVKCGPPKIQIYGGGGIGAVGNAIIGTDGTLMAVHVVRGGHGYAYPPQATALDECHYGSGAVLQVILGETADQWQYFDQATDYEETEYCEDFTWNFGRMWGPNGENLGEWVPSLYTDLSMDPIQNEILKYQKIAREVDNTPWFHTRKIRPGKITSGDSRVLPSWNKVTDACFKKHHRDMGNPVVLPDGGWGEWMNKYAISPVPASNVPGTDYPSILFTFEWDLLFPVTGTYKIKGACDNNAKMYIDNKYVYTLGVYTGAQLNPPLKKQIESGVHNVRIELLNYPVKETIIEGADDQCKGDTVTFKISSAAQFANRVEIPELGVGGAKGFDGPQINTTVSAKVTPGRYYRTIFHSHESKHGIRLRTKGKRVLQMEEHDDMDWQDIVITSSCGMWVKNKGDTTPLGGGPPPVSTKSKLEIKYKGLNSSNETIKVSNGRKTIELKDGKGNDANVRFSISSGDANFSGDGRSIEGRGAVTLSLWYDDNPNYAGEAVRSITIGKTTWVKEKKHKGGQTETITLRGKKDGGGNKGNVCYFWAPPDTRRVISNTLAKEIEKKHVFDTVSSMGKAQRQLWRTNVYSRGGFINEFGVTPFNPMQSLPNNPYAGTHNIVWPNIKFPADGSYRIRIAVDDNVHLRIGDQVDIFKKGFVGDTNNSTGEYDETHTIKAGTYSVVADLYQKPGGRYAYGGPGQVTGSNADIRYRGLNSANNPIRVSGGKTIKLRDSHGSDTNATFKITSGNGRFSSDGKKIEGTGDVTLQLKWDDKRNVAGRAVQSIHIAGKTWSVSKSETGQETHTVSIRGGSIKGINPMALAISIDSAIVTKEVVAQKPWCENPMGIALAIDAPDPTPPQEIPPPQEGRCPPNPIWSTRFPNASERWYPVTGQGHSGQRRGSWSNFMDRYALSPVKPLDSPGSDRSGVVYTNTWPLDIGYDGYYAVKGLGDNKGRVLIDDNEITKLQHFKTENPTPIKTFLKEGKHDITVEIWNKPISRSFTILENIFKTIDWQGGATVLQTGQVDVTFNISTSAEFANGIKIPGLGIDEKKRYKGGQLRKTITKKVTIGKEYEVITSSDQTTHGIRLRTQGDKVLQMEELDDMDWQDLVCTASKGKWIVGSGHKAIFKVEAKNIFRGVDSGTTKNGVTYEGPRLFHHTEAGAIDPSTGNKSTPTRWASYMQHHSVSPWFPDLYANNPDIEGVKTYLWHNVDFPEDGIYSIKFAADNNASVHIGDQLVAGSHSHLLRMDYGYWKVGKWTNVSIPKGKHTIRVDNLNIPHEGDKIFINNPRGFALIIKYNRNIQRTDMTSWKTNPIAASAILIAPPCPKKINGKGVVTEIIPLVPGDWPTDPPGEGDTYNVELDLTKIPVDNTGTNYNCAEDELVVEPSNGFEGKLVCGPYGKIEKIETITPGKGFTFTPNIYIKTKTGINFVPGPPIYTSSIDPLPEVPEKLIQVTDLVGLKQTGYYDGRAYYGAVFYENGTRYAGYYDTAGQRIQIYDTLQESIDAQVTTRPSAIQRSGTDITSNDPRLDIPGTPENLI